MVSGGQLTPDLEDLWNYAQKTSHPGLARFRALAPAKPHETWFVGTGLESVDLACGYCADNGTNALPTY